MKLYLVQHGEATAKEVDPERPLTEKGRGDVSRIAGFLKKAGIKVMATWHSENLRAIQTAQILGEAVSSEIMKQEGLAPNDAVSKWLEELNTRVQDVMIVGHLPFLQKLASLLLAGNEVSQLISFRPGGVACLERAAAGLRPRGATGPEGLWAGEGSAPAGKWSLIWVVPPELI